MHLDSGSHTRAWIKCCGKCLSEGFEFSSNRTRWYLRQFFERNFCSLCGVGNYQPNSVNIFECFDWKGICLRSFVQSKISWANFLVFPKRHLGSCDTVGSWNYSKFPQRWSRGLDWGFWITVTSFRWREALQKRVLDCTSRCRYGGTKEVFWR